MKLAKLSLAAIMTVGALSTVNAGSLEESIKGVDLSGYARYRFQDRNGGTKNDHQNEFKTSLMFTTPVQENLSAVVRLEANGVNLDDQGTSSSNADVNFNRAFLRYTPIEGLAITAGKQYVGSPVEDLSGTGIVAVYSLPAGFTFIAAYYDDVADDQAKSGNYRLTTEDGTDILVPVTEATGANTDNSWAAAIQYVGNSGDMSFGGKLWYLGAESTGLLSNKDNTDNGTAEVIFAEASVGIPVVNLRVQYATADKDLHAAGTAVEENNDNETYRAEVTGTVDMFSYHVGYVSNDEDGGDVRLDKSNDGDNDLIGKGWYTDYAKADTNYYYGGATVKYGKFGAYLNYVDIDIDNAKEGDAEDEVEGRVSYAATKKLSTHLRYSANSMKDAKDSDRVRFEAKYSF